MSHTQKHGWIKVKLELQKLKKYIGEVSGTTPQPLSSERT